MAFLCGSLRRKKKLSDSLSPLQPGKSRPQTRGSGLPEDLQKLTKVGSADLEVQSNSSYATGSLISSNNGKQPIWACYWKNNQKSGVYRPSGERPRPPGGASRPHTQGGPAGGRPPGSEEMFWWDTSADVGTPERQDLNGQNSQNSRIFSMNTSYMGASPPAKSHNSDPETSKITQNIPKTKYDTMSSLRNKPCNPYELLKEIRSAKSDTDITESSAGVKTLHLEDLTTHDATSDVMSNVPTNVAIVAPIPSKITALNSPRKVITTTVGNPLHAPTQESILITSDYELTPEKANSPSKFNSTRFSDNFDNYCDFMTPQKPKRPLSRRPSKFQGHPKQLGQGHRELGQVYSEIGQGHREVLGQVDCYQDQLRQLEDQFEQLGHRAVGQGHINSKPPTHYFQGQSGHFQGHQHILGQIGTELSHQVRSQGHESSNRPMTLTFDDLQCHRSDDVILVSPVLPVPSDIEYDDLTQLPEKEMKNLTPRRPLGLAQGQLKLSVYINHGLLTAHVIQARNIGIKGTKTICSSVVKVNLVPDNGDRAPCVSDIIYDTNNPVYDEKFSFEVSESDQKKRLQVSVWNQSTMMDPNDQSSRDPKLLGCMSFGVRHLLSKKKADVCGWYYLLADEVGKRKHLKVLTDNNPSQSLDCIPKVNKALQGRDTHKALLNRGKQGYGFSLTGNSPVTVGRIEPGSPADLAGLKAGDAIVIVNGKNVSRSTSDSVAKIVKGAQSQLLIEFSRYRTSSVMEPNKENIKDYGNLKDYGSIDGFQFEENKFQSNKIRSSNHSVTVTRETVTKQTVVRDAMTSHHSYQTMSPWQQRRFTGSFHSNGSLSENSCSSEGSFELGDRTAAGNYSTEDHELTRAEQERQLAIMDLMESEQHFVSRMQTGIAWYCRPLRHGVLSSKKHAKLFQNVEKLVALSEFHLKQLEAHGEIWCDGRNTGRVLDSVGVHYYPKILFLSEAYEAYALGLGESLRLLDDLRSYPEFQHFLSKTTTDERLPTIEEFLHMPLQHLNRMFQLLQETLNMTSPDHLDYQALHTVVQALSRSLFAISQPEGQQHKFSLATSACSLSSTESKSSVKSTTSVLSVDSEVLEIQSRLLFPSHIQSFKLAQPNRHFIFSSEIMWVENGKAWSRVILLLFNDVILMTRAEKGGYHLVVDNPVYLNQVNNTVFNSSHPSEFQIICDAPGKKQRYVTFRSFSVEQKCTWKSLLEQRIGSKSQVDLHLGQNMCDLGIAL